MRTKYNNVYHVFVSENSESNFSWSLEYKFPPQSPQHASLPSTVSNTPAPQSPSIEVNTSPPPTKKNGRRRSTHHQPPSCRAPKPLTTSSTSTAATTTRRAATSTPSNCAVATSSNNLPDRYRNGRSCCMFVLSPGYTAVHIIYTCQLIWNPFVQAVTRPPSSLYNVHARAAADRDAEQECQWQCRGCAADAGESVVPRSAGAALFE